MRFYPGSPEIIARLLRREDRIGLNELNPQDADTLAARYSADKRVRVTRLDAATTSCAELLGARIHIETLAEGLRQMLADVLGDFAAGAAA